MRCIVSLTFDGENVFFSSTKHFCILLCFYPINVVTVKELGCFLTFSRFLEKISTRLHLGMFLSR
jgi:hypothetical protein